MASFDYRYAIKECSSCGALYTRNCGCSKGSLEDKILVPCALIRKTLEEVFQDFQDTSESFDGDTTVCGDSLDDIFCQRCTYESLWKKGAHYGYYSPPNKSLFNAQNELLNSQNKLMEQMTSICDLAGQIIQKNEEEKRILEEQASKDRYWKIPICYDGDEDYTIAITPVSSTKEPVNSLSMGDEHLDTIPATESDELSKNPLRFFDSNDDSTLSDDNSFSIDNIDYVDASPPNDEIVSLEVVEIVVPEVGGIDTDILLTIKIDILREKLLNVNLLIANIEALKDNPTPYSDFVTNSSSTSLNSFLEETNTFDNSLPESKTFRFNLEEISSGSTTTRSDLSLSDYEAFYNDHLEEKSSGSTTTHSEFSLSKYDSFIFDLSIKPFPPVDRSDFYHEEFAGELAHIISLPEYDCFCFKNEPELGESTIDVVGDIYPTRELETDIRQKDEKSSQKRQNQARNGKAWKRQSQIKAKDQKVKDKSQQSNPKSIPKKHLMGPPVPIYWAG
ncbi:hypothetical protein Tco_1485097 [Tanacetum coccineum]